MSMNFLGREARYPGVVHTSLGIYWGLCPRWSTVEHPEHRDYSPLNEPALIGLGAALPETAPIKFSITCAYKICNEIR